MNKIKYIFLGFLISLMISISMGVYLYKQVITEFSASRSMLEISLLSSLDNNNTNMVKKILADRIIYDIYYVGKGEFNSQDFKKICKSWDNEIKNLLVKNTNKNNNIVKSNEFIQGFKKLNQLCQNKSIFSGSNVARG